MTFYSELTREQSNQLYAEVLKSGDIEALRKLCLEDLFFLLTIALRRPDVNRPWLYDRCRDVREAPNGYLDLWAREHYKSTIITFALTIQDILNSPDITVGIFSHTGSIARGFLDQIKRELESNEFLKGLFPEVLYADPSRQSPKWSLDRGIIVRRSSNPNAATVQASGLVDGQPTSKHFSLLVYDDVVTEKSVATTDQIRKVTDALALSYNLGAEGGVRRFIGTRYHYNDTYRTILERATAVPRLHPATDNGKLDGNPVFLSREVLKKKRADMGPYIFGAQMLQDPTADAAMSFRVEWLMYYDAPIDTRGWNIYLLCDPASERKKTNDYTVMLVIGLAPDNNYYLLDGVRDRLNLTGRADKLMYFHRKWKPLATGYEKYGKDSDIEHIEYTMAQKNYRFRIEELGGRTAKEDRIRGLVPLFEQHRFFLPGRLIYADYERVVCDLTKLFVDDEFLAFPVAVHDDILDCMARITDPKMKIEFPLTEEYEGLMIYDNNEDRVKTEYELFA